MKKFLLALLLVPSLLLAQEQSNANATIEFDIDSNTLTYFKMNGLNGNPFGPDIQGQSTIQTAGSNTTVTEFVAGALPFTLLAVGDAIFVRRPDGTVDRRIIVAKASGASITINTPVDWTGGFAFTWRDLLSGTAVTDGWISASAAAATTFHIQYDQGDLNTLAVRVECRGGYPGALPIQVFPACAAGACATEQAYTTVGIASRSTFVVVDPVFTECRVGLRYTTTDTSDAGANLESVTVGVTRSGVPSR